jgi:hypothetical protein
MKHASDAQEYRIQRSLLESDTPGSLCFMEELCYEAHSTALLPEREPFHARHEGCMDGSIDDIWWNAEKKIESIEYFMD